jgi:MFS transporter, PAT family, beta-lactamase induction signal transducer AmpG
VQYAIFSSLMTLFPKLLGGYSGSIVEAVGYAGFFILTTLLGLPVLVLVWRAGRRLELKTG